MKTYKDYIIEASLNAKNIMLTSTDSPSSLNGTGNTPYSLKNFYTGDWFYYSNDGKIAHKKISSIDNPDEVFKFIVFDKCTDNKKDMLEALNRFSSDYAKSTTGRPLSLLLARNWKFVKEEKNFEYVQYNAFTNSKKVYKVNKAYTFKPDNTNQYLHIYFV